MLYNEEAVRANIRNREGKRIFYLGKGDQLTSAARDYLSRERIEIRPGEQAKQDCFPLLTGGFLTEKPEHMTHLNGIRGSKFERLHFVSVVSKPTSTGCRETIGAELQSYCVIIILMIQLSYVDCLGLESDNRR